MPLVLVAVADGSEEIETVAVIDVLRRGQVDVIVASVHDHKEVTASRGVKIVADKTLKDISTDETFDAIVCPGGLNGAKNLASSAPLIALIRKHDSAGAFICAICAAPSLVLQAHNLIGERRATGHPAHMDDLPVTSSNRVVKDKNLITSRGPGTAIEFGLAILEALCGGQARDAVAAPMVLA